MFKDLPSLGIKPVPSLLPNVDLSTINMQVFIINERGIQYKITTDEMILQQIFSLISDFKCVNTMS